MEQTHFVQKAIIGDQAVYLLVPGLAEALRPVLDRLQRGEAVEADTRWYFGRSKETGTVIVLRIDWDGDTHSNVGFAEQHWSLLPPIVERDIIGITHVLTDEGETPGVVPFDGQGAKVRDLLDQLELIR